MIIENALRVLEARYFIKDKNGNVTETAEEMFNRVASCIATADKGYGADENAISELTKEFQSVMENLEFLPNSPTLMNAGTDIGQLSACFVLPVEDSMEGIFESIKETALIHKSGGGTGFNFSNLRARGAPVGSTGGIASGPVSFMYAFDAATHTVSQGGKRRGANMGILNIDHPDILNFINCKTEGDKLNNFNISVGLTNRFMTAVEKNLEYELIDPRTQKPVKKLNARFVFDQIVSAAYKNGEPGVLFLDRIENDNVVPDIYTLNTTNPCGEQPLGYYESCNLGSINMSKMVDEVNKSIDYNKLKRTIHTAVHFLDNVIDINRYPLAIIDETTKQTRKIGLGIMGWADALLMMDIPYDDDMATRLAEDVMGFVQAEGRAASEELAEKRGAFPLFDQSTLKTPIRNATVTTIAPTGTISIIAGCSSGIEPVFAYAYIRNVMDGKELLEINPILKRKLKERGLYTNELMHEIVNKGSLKNIDMIPDDIKTVFVSSQDISPEHHVRIQAAFQKYTDNAVSKTVNFPYSASKEDVAEVYKLAYKYACKGITVYRDGSRDEQVLNIKKVNKVPGEETNKKPAVRKRPKVVSGITEERRIGCGKLFITVNCDNYGLCEVFTSTGKNGGCPSQSEATARVISVALRSGLKPEVIIEQLRGIRCSSTIRQSDMDCTSCPDAIARTMQKELEKENMLNQEAISLMPTDLTESDGEHIPNLGECPDCHQKTLVHQDGCCICLNCSYSKCGG